jgi:hypothetical protein
MSATLQEPRKPKKHSRPERTPTAPPWDQPAQFADAVVAPSRPSSSLAALLTGHILQDGEVILLILKPSFWFIILSCLRWAAAIAILLVAGKIYDEQIPGRNGLYVEAGIFVLAGRLMFAVLQWMSRLYVLTDMRILRLSGVFKTELFDCSLRKVAATRICYTTRERILGLGSIDIIPTDPDAPCGQWQTIERPKHVQEEILAAISRAKQGGCT